MRFHKLVLLGAGVAVAIAAGARVDAQAKTGKLTQIRANTNIEASRFAKPAPVAPPKK